MCSDRPRKARVIPTKYKIGYIKSFTLVLLLI